MAYDYPHPCKQGEPLEAGEEVPPLLAPWGATLPERGMLWVKASDGALHKQRSNSPITWWASSTERTFVTLT